MKQKEIKFLMDVAKLAAEQSYAIRLKVGGVVTDSLGNLIAYAYNGTPRGADNSCERKEYAQHIQCTPDENYPCVDLVSNNPPYRLVTKDNVIHCEQNLIAHAARRGISVLSGKVFLTHSPCMHCASMLIQSGISDVYFLEKFRTFDEVFKEYNSKLNFIKA